MRKEANAPTEGEFVSVVFARAVSGRFTYRVKPALNQITIGHVVGVPFGRKGLETAYVVDRTDSTTYDPKKIKSVSRLLDKTPAFDSNQLSFFTWIANYYLAPLGAVIQTALPSSMRATTLRILTPSEAGIGALTEKIAKENLLTVLREVVTSPGLTQRGLVRRLNSDMGNDDVKRAIRALLRKEWIVWGEKEIREASGTVTTVTLNGTPEAAVSALPRSGKRMLAIIHSLAKESPQDLSALIAAQGGSTRDALKRLEAANIITKGTREQRDPLTVGHFDGSATPPALNDDQKRALKALTAQDASGGYLLFGVTGSGKTEVFLGAAAHAIAQQHQVLVLVPEIGLTPQLVGRFRARFGDQVAVLHSGLTGAERLAQWRRIRAKEATIAVGARSALFAPFDNLGLIVVDEEHDDSYKQNDGVLYNARDLAIVLGHRHECPIVLASATPSLESWSNAQRGTYTTLRLPKRATPAPVPLVELVDISTLKADDGPKPLFAPHVIEALHRTFDAGGKAIVLYNRRGFATMVECGSCGGTYECPNCAITMTLHKGARVMACHYCGLRVPYSDTCPSCHADDLTELGKGTERIEERLNALFPEAGVIRMDADTTATRGAHHRLLEAFRNGEDQLLIGTQIVAKGHDFPNVHTAVVVSADRGFRMPDFRAAERTYALLVQLAGRAGRGDVPGKVFVQTYQPDHYVLKHLDDVEKFLTHESTLRHAMRYPPHARMVLIRLDGTNRDAVNQAARSLANELKRKAGQDSVDIMGPANAALPILVGRWRVQIVIRGSDTRALRKFLQLNKARLVAAPKRGVRIRVDVDPRQLL